jgi:histone H3/H4
MSTRTAKDNSIFHQNRYASSAEFERGLIANLVAKRCSTLDAKADRELIWFVQYLSHQPGSMAAVVGDLLAKFPHRLGTPAMVAAGKRAGQNFNADEVAEIRQEIPRKLRRRFPLRGETQSEICKTQSERNSILADRARQLRELADDAFARVDENLSGELPGRQAREQEDTKKHPASYPVATFLDLCRQAAELGDDSENGFYSLEKELCELCLKPGRNLESVGPWYFSDLVNVLREHHQQWVKEKSKVVVTTLGAKISDTLNYCAKSRCLALMEGNARMGKSFAGRAWCEQHPGQSRFVEVPPGNDDASFFRALARGLGLGNFLSYKVIDIRERVESVLLNGDLLLVLDEAQRLWPQRIRYSFPSRIEWVMTMVNEGVPICGISTPQFMLMQKAIEKNGWNSAQLTGRLYHYDSLPTELTTSDLMAVARQVLPEASEVVLTALADYARMSSRYLAAVDSIAKRAHYIAACAGRERCTTEDVRAAMKESVIPSDTMLVRSLESVKNTSGRGRRLAPVLPDQTETIAPAAARETRPALPLQNGFIRRANSPELVKS